jgi:hypothetical protein
MMMQVFLDDCVLSVQGVNVHSCVPLKVRVVSFRNNVSPAGMADRIEIKVLSSLGIANNCSYQLLFVLK